MVLIEVCSGNDDWAAELEAGILVAAGRLGHALFELISIAGVHAAVADAVVGLAVKVLASGLGDARHDDWAVWILGREAASLDFDFLDHLDVGGDHGAAVETRIDDV